MSDCIMCGEASGGSEYAICAECCEANAASERRFGKQCAECYDNCDCSAEYFGDKCPCCSARELVSQAIMATHGVWLGFQETGIMEEEKRRGPQLIAYGFVALFSFAAGVAFGWLIW